MPIRTMALNQNYLTMNNATAKIINSKRQIAPIIKEEKPNFNIMTNNNNSLSLSDGRYKRKYNYNGNSYPSHQSASVVRRNARERNRVKQVNNGFANLRQHIPVKVISALSNTNGRGASKKLSKVDTLKLAVEYIKSLQSLLDECENKKHNKAQGVSHHLNYSSSHSSEISVSPTPSYASDTSLIGNNNSYQIKDHFKTEPYDIYSEHQQSDTPSPTIQYPNANYIHANPYKKPVYDQYTHSQVSPDDEELLDTIAWWQEQQ